jgi:ubiquinone/menaquinone biosynthesis C-methylase UbiE
MSATLQQKPYKGMAMEGVVARWYARLTAKDAGQFAKEAAAIAGQVPGGSAILEVAPGPGYLAIELAKLGSYRIVGLDISKSFVRIATENATKAGVDVNFKVGNASAMLFEPNSFDFIYCRAAFKNFSEPVKAIGEMYRVLKPGGSAVIYDMLKDASAAAIKEAMKEMNLGWFDSLMTAMIFPVLRKRAYLQSEFKQMVAQTPFATCQIDCKGMGAKVIMRK